MGVSNATRQTVPPQRAEPQRSPSHPGSQAAACSQTSSIARLQRTVGNSAISRLLRARTIQPKLTVSHPEDESELEADRVADQVMRMPEPPSQPAAAHASPTIQRARSECEDELRRKPDFAKDRIPEEEDDGIVQAKLESPVSNVAPHINRACEHCQDELQRKTESDRDEEQIVSARRESGSSTDVSSGGESRINNLRSVGGEQLPDSVRTFFEPRFGQDFSGVRVHKGSHAAESAREIHARAYTSGRDIVFGAGEYNPETNEGKRLLAHELTHVSQQGFASKLSDDPVTANGVTTSFRSKELETQRLAVVRPQTVSRQVSPTTAKAEATLELIPEGGKQIDQVGIINRDKPPEVRLRSSPSTEANNIIRTLPFNTIVQVIKSFPGDWLFVSTSTGELGYVASTYVSLNSPEPNAQLHRVESGVKGTAIAIAERYYGPYADNWGQDLRYYVNVLAWANKISVPKTADGWKQVNFKADNLIWIPSYAFARGLKSVVASGSSSYDIADSLGVAGYIKRGAQLWDDIRAAVSLSKKYLPDAISRHVEQAIGNALYSLAVMLVVAVGILAITTALGAAIGFFLGAGVGAAPGAAIGFEVGMVILDWIGLAMLLAWIGQAIWETAKAFGLFFGTVWHARGDKEIVDLGAQHFAEAIGVLLGNLLEALVLFAASWGIGKAVGLARGSKVGKAMGEHRTGEWLGERVRRVRAGETKIVGPKLALPRFFRGVELVEGKNPLGEIDGVDLATGKFVENTAATSLGRLNPKTGKPEQTLAEWAKKKIFGKTNTRIKNLDKATSTRPTKNGSKKVPTLAEIKGIKHIHFKIDGNTAALRAVVYAEIANLKAAHPGWTFTVEFGVSINVPPVPDEGLEQEGE